MRTTNRCQEPEKWNFWLKSEFLIFPKCKNGPRRRKTRFRTFCSFEKLAQVSKNRAGNKGSNFSLNLNAKVREIDLIAIRTRDRKCMGQKSRQGLLYWIGRNRRFLLTKIGPTIFPEYLSTNRSVGNLIKVR